MRNRFRKWMRAHPWSDVPTATAQIRKWVRRKIKRETRVEIDEALRLADYERDINDETQTQ